MVLPIAYQFSLLARSAERAFSLTVRGRDGDGVEKGEMGGVDFGVEGFERMYAYSDTSN